MVLNTSKKQQVFGVVENAEENKDYVGKETSTAKVTVDNVNREISVDVDIFDLIGETADKAYPGNKGNENRQAIEFLRDDLRSEIARAKYEESDIREDVQKNRSESKLADEEIITRISAEETRSQDIDKSTELQINYITTNYAEKTYVIEKISEFGKLSKQIVDSVDVDRNVVIRNGVEEKALDGVIYLVSDTTNEGEKTYRQYTSIDGRLTLIGDTKIDLEDYATKEFVINNYATTQYVNEQINAIPDVDLTGYATEEWVQDQDYATRNELPDVSSFISQIPEEYITEKELEDKQYLTTKTAEEDFATKIYVQQEIAKIGSFSKVIVDSVDVENKTVTTGDEITPAEQDVIYLVPVVESSETVAYEQWMLINDELTNIGNTSVDLEGYATTEYVDKKTSELKTEISDVSKDLKTFIESFNDIAFIDGGSHTQFL